MGETYPRIYRYGPGSIAVTWGFGLVFIGGAAACAIFAGQWASHAPWLLRGICVPIGLFGLLLLLSLTCRLTLYEDCFEYKGLIAVRRVTKADIVRTQNVKKKIVTTTLTVALKDGRKVEVSDFGRMDDVFAEWFDAFPNAENEARKTRDEALLANPAFGSNPTEREAHVNADVDRLNLLGWPCYGIAMWGMIWPQPYQVCLPVLLTMPLLGLIATYASQGRWGMLEGHRTGRLSIGNTLFVAPASIVALRALTDDHVVDGIMPAVWGAATGIGLMALNGLIERRLSWARAVGFAVLWGLYAWGGLLYADTRLDPAPGRAIPVQVRDKGEGEHDHSLTVTAWGPRKSDNEVVVGRRLFGRVHKGGTVCIYVYPGRLNWPWYEAGLCPRGK